MLNHVVLKVAGGRAGVFVRSFAVAATLTACTTVTWKEEALLHDGNKMIVARSHTYDARVPHEIGQSAPLVESTASFTPPGTKQHIAWKSDFGRAYQDNLVLLLVDVVNGIPYIATEPAGCAAYNKWKRPNPPYVFFKYEGEWKQIPLQEFPAELDHPNIVVGGPSAKEIDTDPLITVERVTKLNRSISVSDRTIARTPIKNSTTNCEELVYYKGAWISSKGTFGREFMDKISK